jgi:hypothetical protein
MAILIPLPHNGVIIPAASPIMSTWSSTCDFLSKLICEMVTGVSNSISLLEKICLRWGFSARIVFSISLITPLQAFRLAAVVR